MPRRRGADVNGKRSAGVRVPRPSACRLSQPVRRGSSGKSLSYTRRVSDDLAGPGPAPPEPGRARRGRRLAWSAAIFSVATGLSRIIGLFREIVVRRYFGVEGSINAFTVAFQVPNLIRALAADVALSSAF